jgi:hypothetical protein
MAVFSYNLLQACEEGLLRLSLTDLQSGAIQENLHGKSDPQVIYFPYKPFIGG